jgi:tetratricopeptide (TPR) repeat protein
MEPGNWRHQFQLGIAAWGSERLRCLSVVMAQYPALTHAHFAAALVHIARGDLDAADAVLATGLEMQRKTPSDRLPGRGLHWLRGLIAFRRDQVEAARVCFDAELTTDGHDLFADEFAVDALTAHGFTRLATKEPAEAAAFFERALQRVPDHARAWMGLGEARRRLGDEGGAADARQRGVQGQQDLVSYGRRAEAEMAGALAFFLDGDINDACAALTKFLAEAPAGMAASTLPVEPWLRPLLNDKRIVTVLRQLADRAK